MLGRGARQLSISGLISRSSREGFYLPPTNSLNAPRSFRLSMPNMKNDGPTLLSLQSLVSSCTPTTTLKCKSHCGTEITLTGIGHPARLQQHRNKTNCRKRARRCKSRRGGPPKILSSCRYRYASMAFAAARRITLTSPSTNVPSIHCPFCPAQPFSGEPENLEVQRHNSPSHTLPGPGGPIA